jgi:hypothetical protein
VSRGELREGGGATDDSLDPQAKLAVEKAANAEPAAVAAVPPTKKRRKSKRTKRKVRGRVVEMWGWRCKLVYGP